MTRLARAALAPALAVAVAAAARADVVHERGREAEVLAAYLRHALTGDVGALEEAIAAGGETSFLAFEQALAALRQDDRTRMIERARRAIELDPRNGDAHALLARVSFDMAQRGLGAEEALGAGIAHAEAAVELGTADGDLFDQLAAAWGARAARAESEGERGKAREARARQHDVLRAWADQLHHELAYQRLSELAREKNDPHAEMRALREELRRGPAGLLAVQRLADVLRRLDRCDAALPLLREAFAEPDLDKYAAITLAVNLGECELEAGPAPLAEAAFRRAIELDPTNLLAAGGLAEALWLQGRREEAERALSVLAQPDGASGLDVERRTDFLETRARWRLSHGLPEGLDDARKAAALEAATAPRQAAGAQVLVAQALVALGRPVEGAEAAREALERDPAHEGALVALADALWSAGRMADAERAIAAAEKQAGTRAPWLERVARWEAARGLDDAARRHALAALEAVGGDRAGAEQRAAVGEVLLVAGVPDEAEALLREALESRPGDVEILFDLAAALGAQGRAEEAAQVHDAATISRDEYLLERRARSESARRLHDRALRTALEAKARLAPVETDPRLARFEALIGEVALAAGRIDDALDAFGRAEERQARQPELRRLAHATALAKAGRHADALAILDRALAAEPRDSGLRLERGRLLLQSGDVQAGTRALLALLTDDAGLAARHAQVALVLAENGAPAQAREVAGGALAKFPGHVPAWLTSARLHERSGRLDAAEADLRKALDLTPDAPGTLNALGYFLADHGRELEESVALLRRAVARRPHEAAYLDSLGWALHRSGRHDEAARAIEAAVARDRDPVVVMHLATIREAQGRRDEALALYREALDAGLDEDVTRVTSRVQELAAGREPAP